MLTFINNDATRIVRCSDAVGYPLRSLRETAALGGFLRNRVSTGSSEEVQSDHNQITGILKSFAENYSTQIEDVLTGLANDILSPTAHILTENLKTMIASLRAFPEIRGFGLNGRVVQGCQSLLELSFKVDKREWNIWFDAYVVKYREEELVVGRKVVRGFVVDVKENSVSKKLMSIAYNAMSTQAIREMLESNKAWYDLVCVSGAFLIHVIDKGSPSLYQSIVNPLTVDDLVVVPGFGGITSNIKDESVDTAFKVGIQSFAVSESEIYTEFDLRTTSSARLAKRGMTLSEIGYNEIMSRAINASSGLTTLAEGYGNAVNDALSGLAILDIGGKRGLNLLALKLRLEAFGYHKLLTQDNILELMKLLSAYSAELGKIPTIDLHTLDSLADDGFRLQYLDSKDGDAILDAKGRLVLALGNSKVNSVPYYAKLPSEIEKLGAPEVILSNRRVEEDNDVSAEEGDTIEDTDDVTPNKERDELMLRNALHGVNQEIVFLESRVSSLNAGLLNEQVIAAQRALDDIITSVVSLQGAQAVLNAQAQAILTQVSKLLAYPVISAVYGQQIGLLGDYTEITYDTGSRTFTVKIDKDAMAAALAKVAYCSTRVKYSCGVYDVYRGDTVAPNAWSKRERLEIVGSTVEGVRNGYHKISYLFDTESAKNMGVNTSLQTFVLCTEKKKKKFWKKTVVVTPHTEVQRYSLPEDAFVSTMAAYLLKILNSEVMKAVAGIAEVIKACFESCKAEANKVATLKANLAEMTNLQDLLGAALTQRRLIEFEISLPSDSKPFAGVIGYAKNLEAEDFEFTFEKDEAPEKSDTIKEKLNRLAFASLNLTETENENRRELEIEKQNLLQSLSAFRVDSSSEIDDSDVSLQVLEGVSYGFIEEILDTRVLITKNEEQELPSNKWVLEFGEVSLDILEEYHTIREAIDQFFSERGNVVTVNKENYKTLQDALEQLIEKLKFRFPDIEARISKYRKKISVTNSTLTELVDRFRENAKALSNIADYGITLNGVKLLTDESESSSENTEIRIDPSKNATYKFSSITAVGGYIFTYELKVKDQVYYVRVVDRQYPTENGEVAIPFGSVYYSPTSLVRLLYKLGLSNSTTKAVLAKIYEGFGVLNNEQLQSLYASLDLTAREEAILQSQHEGNVNTDAAYTTEYRLAGLLFLLIDPSNLGLSRILQTEVTNIPDVSDDDEEVAKRRSQFAKAVFASCCYDNNSITI